MHPAGRKNKTLGAIFRQGNTLALLEQNYAVWQVRAWGAAAAAVLLLLLLLLLVVVVWQVCTKGLLRNSCMQWGTHCCCWLCRRRPLHTSPAPCPARPPAPPAQALHKASDGTEVDLVAAVNRMAMEADKAEAAAAGGRREQSRWVAPCNTLLPAARHASSVLRSE